MPGVSTWFERFVDADRVFVLLENRDAADERGHDSFREGMCAIARDEEPGPIRCIEDYVEKAPDKSGWEAFCGSYEWKDYRIDVRLRDGDLFATFRHGGEEDSEGKLYPLGEKTFGLKDEYGDIVFGDGILTFYGIEGKKL